ncbi:DUF742 domain-containing protein [Nocardia otitidiscaviarum]
MRDLELNLFDVLRLEKLLDTGEFGDLGSGSVRALLDRTRALAEIAARLHLPITATKILVGDLIGDGVLDFRAPAVGPGAADDLTVLRAVLKGIQAL